MKDRQSPQTSPACKSHPLFRKLRFMSHGGSHFLSQGYAGRAEEDTPSDDLKLQPAIQFLIGNTGLLSLLPTNTMQQKSQSRKYLLEAIKESCNKILFHPTSAFAIKIWFNPPPHILSSDPKSSGWFQKSKFQAKFPFLFLGSLFVVEMGPGAFLTISGLHLPSWVLWLFRWHYNKNFDMLRWRKNGFTSCINVSRPGHTSSSSPPPTKMSDNIMKPFLR